jgi:methyl-accepting chemotaxis protein
MGLSEVNMAVNQMDQVTQRNAAMVEETNAASGTLTTEVERLRSLVGQFQLLNADLIGTHLEASADVQVRRPKLAYSRKPY